MTLSRPRVPIEERKPLTPARRRRILARQGPLCARPDCVADWSEVDDNLEGLCAICHAEKTARDIPAIAKAKRLERDASPETRRQSKHRIRSRRFTPADPLKPKAPHHG